jgi:hypothetical protein
MGYLGQCRVIAGSYVEMVKNTAMRMFVETKSLEQAKKSASIVVGEIGKYLSTGNGMERGRGRGDLGGK